MKAVMQKVLFVLFIGIALLCTSFSARAADEEVTREFIQTNRKAIVEHALEMNQQESQDFWPIFNDYRNEVIKEQDRKAKLIFDFLDNYENLSDEKAAEILDEFITIESKMLKLRKKYVKKFKKVLPAKKVAKYVQVENKMRAIINLELAREIPLVK